MITKAKRMSAPDKSSTTDLWTQVIDIELPPIVDFERPSGGAGAITLVSKLLSNAKFPVILNGAGVVLGEAIPASRNWQKSLMHQYVVITSIMTHSLDHTQLFAGP
ncbi:MAG: hypothetical protein CM1200mP28_01390 [Deltaproteobacteria bacterium]|nr:MAG: hypothetical protein CM1200mP28_01390 [Deltaproteobacteria bacterium]